MEENDFLLAMFNQTDERFCPQDLFNEIFKMKQCVFQLSSRKNKSCSCHGPS